MGLLHLLDLKEGIGNERRRDGMMLNSVVDAIGYVNIYIYTFTSRFGI
jgi:hypothetical protein